MKTSKLTKFLDKIREYNLVEDTSNKTMKPLISKPNQYFHKGLINIASKDRKYKSKELKGFIFFFTVIFTIASLAFDSITSALIYARWATNFVKAVLKLIIEILTGGKFLSLEAKYRKNNRQPLEVKSAEEVINTWSLRNYRRALRDLDPFKLNRFTLNPGLPSNLNIDPLCNSAGLLIKASIVEQRKAFLASSYKEAWSEPFDEMHKNIPLDLLPTFKLVK